MELKQLSLLFLGLLSRRCQGCEREWTTTKRLKADIFCGYDPDLPPVRHHTNQTLISLVLFPQHIVLDEDTNSLYIGTLIYLSWMDESLTWSPKDYDNIAYIQVRPNTIWLPDISAYDSLNLHLHRSQTSVLLHTGRVGSVLRSELTAFCAMDLTNWPYDEHTCTASIGSQTYHGPQLDFAIHKSMGINMVSYMANKQWQLKEVNATRIVTSFTTKNSLTYDVTVEFRFIVKRHGVFVISTVFIPVLLLSLLVLCSMAAPLSGKRCYNTLALSALGHLAYLQYIGSKVSHNADNPILIVSYVRDSLIMTVIALITCVLVDNVTTTEQLPIWLCNLLKHLESSRYTRLILIPQVNFKQKDEDVVGLIKSASISNDWSTLVLVIQRLIFIVYLIVYFVMLVAFF